MIGSLKLEVSAPIPGRMRTEVLSEEETGAPAASTARGVQLRELTQGVQGVLGDRWEVLGSLAEGGMATILQVRHRVHEGLFVAKVLRPELAARPEVLHSFREEARAASRLGSHPNAVPVFDMLWAGHVPLLLMPFIEGEDLDCLLQRNGPLSRTEAMQFATQMASLLSHAESHGITHGDLSPGNIRLDQFGRWRVLDFGLACAADSREPYHALGGTPLYTSPEQIAGETPDIRTDLYALGLLLVEVLTGKPLLHAETLDAIRERHLQGITKLPATIEEDAALAHTLRKMLQRDRNERMGSAAELSQALAVLGFRPPELMRPDAGASRRNRLSPH